MTTDTASQRRVISRTAASTPVEVAAPSRREFLYYIWGASIVLLLGEATAGLIWFALPRFKEGTFGGIFNYLPDQVPTVDQSPVNVPEGRFWVSNVANEGFIILYAVCTHLGCLFKWVDNNNRFECPCHGSKYQRNGKYIEGPAPRSLDRFRTAVTFEDGTTAVTNDAGDPMPLEGRAIAAIRIDTGGRIKRPGRV
ncbi:MAG: Rieske 2Fe-2S domain-containing protein [Anaerolineae bacterium]|nr:Rieske 2Fe-2S domain-containing protein [Anaerolineae bacterium]